MAIARKVALVFPTGGVDRKFALQGQRPFTAADAINVRSNDPLERRERGGSRPGLGKAYALEMGVLWTGEFTGTENEISNFAGGVTPIQLSTVSTELKLNGVDKHFNSSGVPSLVGLTFKFLATGNTFLIVSKTGDQTLELAGDANTGESENDGDRIEIGSQQINMATMMRSTNASGRGHFIDDFSGPGTALAPLWTVATYPALVPLPNTPDTHQEQKSVFAIPVIHPNGGFAQPQSFGSATTEGTLYAAIAADVGIDNSAPYTIRMNYVAFNYDQFTMYAKINDTSDLVKSIVIKINHKSNDNSMTMWVNNVQVNHRSRPLGGPQHWIEIRFQGARGLFSVYHGNSSVGNLFFDWLGSDSGWTGDQFGFGVQFGSPITTANRGVDSIEVSYNSSTGGGFPPDGLILASGGKLYREGTVGTMQEINSYGSIDNLAHDRQLMAVDRVGKLYIADTGDVRKENTAAGGKIEDGVLKETGFSNWDKLGIDIEGDVVEITNLTSGGGVFASITGSVYGIVSPIGASSGLILKDLGSGATISDTADDVTSCNYRVLRSAKIYDSGTDALSLYTAPDVSSVEKGDVPIGCDIIALWLDRICMAGDPNNPGVWYMSAASDPLDWDYGATVLSPGDSVAAAGTATDSEVGGLPVPITALVAHSEDYFLIAGASEMWVMRGDPLIGIPLNNVSRTIGIVDKLAWTHDSGGRLFWLSREGIFTLPPGVVGDPQPVSENRIPQALKGVNTDDNYVSLTYDSKANGIHIFVSPIIAGTVAHYFLHTDIGAFWPVEFQASCDPATSLHHPTPNAVIVGCRDGFARSFDDAFYDDDGTTISSTVMLGPIALGRNSSDSGLLESIQAALDSSSGKIDYTIHVGDTPEEAFEAPSSFSGTFEAGFNYLERPSLRGSFAYVRLTNHTTTIRIQDQNAKGVIVDGVLDDSTPVNDWDDHLIDITRDTVEITNITSGTGVFTIERTYGISALSTADGLTLKDLVTGSNLGNSDDAASCNYKVIAGSEHWTMDYINLERRTSGGVLRA